MNDNNIFGEIIYSYTPAQAIADGVLIDVSEAAKEAGFKIPVVMTETVWDQYVAWADDDTEKQIIQDQSGRLQDILWLLYLACKRSHTESSCIYEVNIIPRDGYSKTPVPTRLKSVIDRGDNGEPVITLMLPNED